jgi:hypothetical protein
MAGAVLAGCRGCGSPFLRPGLGGETAVCRSCGRVHILQRGESLPVDAPAGEVTTIQGHPDLPAGAVIVNRWRPDGLVCQHVAAAPAEGAGE